MPSARQTKYQLWWVLGQLELYEENPHALNQKEITHLYYVGFSQAAN